ncbi:MAG TPA: M28 family peptidase [Flavitalea sp.]|nr:M28 family peptidase [Flavitalea sp.]
MDKRRFTRSGFIRLAGGAGLLALTGGLKAFSQSPGNSRHLVDTPLKREQYLFTLLKRICTDIGVHRFGTPEYEQVALIIKKEMELALPKVEQDYAPFSLWEATNGPSLHVGDQELEVMPYKGIAGTPEGGVTGLLKKHESGSYYILADTHTGKEIAIISVNEYGRAISSSAYRNDREIGYVDPERPVEPRFNIGKQDRPVLEAAVANKTPVRANIQTRFLPPEPGSSIIGTLPGKTSEEILFLAHADSPYNSPGANDNTASVIIMLMLAHAFSGLPQKKTITFMATGGEEDGKVGAIHYAERRKREGTLNNIRYVVNFDSLTYGPNLQLYSREKDLKDIIGAIHRDLKIEGAPKYFDSNGFVMDAMPFRHPGAKALYVNSRGYDGITLPVYHRPEDLPVTVAANCAEIGFRVFGEFIRRLQEI